MRVKALIWLGVRTPPFDAMTRLFKAMGLEVFRAERWTRTGDCFESCAEHGTSLAGR